MTRQCRTKESDPNLLSRWNAHRRSGSTVGMGMGATMPPDSPDLTEYYTEIRDRVRTYDPPPAGFDPLTATNSRLAWYGLPTRPDSRTEPEFFQFWRRMLG